MTANRKRKRHMYLKKIEGPRAVSLPDGTVMTRADLPPANTVRWVASRKLLVVKGVMFGLITKKQAYEKYDLSEDELGEWISSYLADGKAALHATWHPERNQL